ALRAERGEHAAIADLAEGLTYADEIASYITMVSVLDYAVPALAFLGHGEQAAVVAGSLGDDAPFTLNPTAGPESGRRARARTQARALLGDDAYAVAFERGRAMTRDEVVAWLRATLAQLQYEATDA